MEHGQSQDIHSEIYDSLIMVWNLNELEWEKFKKVSEYSKVIAGEMEETKKWARWLKEHRDICQVRPAFDGVKTEKS